MRLPKKFQVDLSKSARYQRIIQSVFAWYIGLVLRSTRWTYVGFDQTERDLADGKPRIFCAWHGRLALMPYFREWHDHPMTAVGSAHVDAQIATKFMEKKGVKVLKLPTSGSKTAPIKMAVRELRKGGSLGITPDGPFGPRCMAQPGAIMMASVAQVRVSAVAYSTSRRFTAKSWDRFVVPLPFGRGVFVIDDGFVPAKRLDEGQMQKAQDRLTELLNKVAQEADRLADLPKKKTRH